MPAHASSAPDRLLDLNDLLRELVSQGYLTQATAEQCLTIRRSAVNNQQHPLEFLAAQQLDDLKLPARSLSLKASPVGWPNNAVSPFCASIH